MGTGACTRLELVLVVALTIMGGVHRLARLVGDVLVLLRVLPCIVVAVVLIYRGRLLFRIPLPTLSRLALVLETIR